jgi:pimeloyl-ACP methyl ester carboxylesterase
MDDVLDLTTTRLAGDRSRDRLLIVGPSLGTRVDLLWSQCAALLADSCEVIGWELPGHGRGAPATEPFTIADLADCVRRIAATHAHGRAAYYAGVSLGGAAGFELALDPGPFRAVATIAAAPQIGEPEAWRERAKFVRGAGTVAVMVEGSAQRWFAPGFIERRPAVSAALLDALAEVDSHSYACACEALAAFDIRDRMDRIAVPVAVMTGEHDGVVTEEHARAATGLDVTVLRGVAHLPPAEDPVAAAATLAEAFGLTFASEPVTGVPADPRKTETMP